MIITEQKVIDDVKSLIMYNYTSELKDEMQLKTSYDDYHFIFETPELLIKMHYQYKSVNIIHGDLEMLNSLIMMLELKK